MCRKGNAFLLRKRTGLAHTFLLIIQGNSTLDVTVKGFSSSVSFHVIASIHSNIYNDINYQGKLENSTEQAKKTNQIQKDAM